MSTTTPPVVVPITTIRFDSLRNKYYLDPAVTISHGGQLQIDVQDSTRDYFVVVSITSQPTPTTPGSINVHS